MSSDLELFNIETLLIESGSMESIQEALDDMRDLFSLPEEAIEYFRVLIYKHYYVGRMDSNRYVISGIREFVDTSEHFSADHAEVVKLIIDLSNEQMN